MMRNFHRMCVAALLAVVPASAETIQWFSDAGMTNQDSGGLSMDAGFTFELGVFSGGFVPTSSNVAQWRSKWVAADSATYNVPNKRFVSNHVVEDNTAPFTVGASAWIFGYRDTPTGSEWILVRRNTWTWPTVISSVPFPSTTEWNVKDANQVVLGTINTGGILMKSAAVQSYAQWQVANLTGEPLAGSNDDPDRDGTPNLLEYVFGSPPKTPGAPPAISTAVVDGHVQITIPRRTAMTAALVVEVSGDLTTWASGAAQTQVVSDGPSALVVRDLTAFDSAQPRRFYRLRAVLP